MSDCSMSNFSGQEEIIPEGGMPVTGLGMKETRLGSIAIMQRGRWGVTLVNTAVKYPGSLVDWSGAKYVSLVDTGDAVTAVARGYEVPVSYRSLRADAKWTDPEVIQDLKDRQTNWLVTAGNAIGDGVVLTGTAEGLTGVANLQDKQIVLAGFEKVVKGPIASFSVAIAGDRTARMLAATENGIWKIAIDPNRPNEDWSFSQIASLEASSTVRVVRAVLDGIGGMNYIWIESDGSPAHMTVIHTINESAKGALSKPVSQNLGSVLPGSLRIASNQSGYSAILGSVDNKLMTSSFGKGCQWTPPDIIKTGVVEGDLAVNKDGEAFVIFKYLDNPGLVGTAACTGGMWVHEDIVAPNVRYVAASLDNIGIAKALMSDVLHVTMAKKNIRG